MGFKAANFPALYDSASCGELFPLNRGAAKCKVSGSMYTGKSPPTSGHLSILHLCCVCRFIQLYDIEVLMYMYDHV